MTIEIKFTAETVPELMGYITAYLASVSGPHTEAPPQPMSPEEALETVLADAEKIAKKRGRPRKEPEVSFVNGSEEEDEDMEIPSTESSGSLDAVALQKLKMETLARLRDLFMAGKGAKIRELLKKHGHGALVFPEIEAKHFPAIKADIDRELGS